MSLVTGTVASLGATVAPLATFLVQGNLSHPSLVWVGESLVVNVVLLVRGLLLRRLLFSCTGVPCSGHWTPVAVFVGTCLCRHGGQSVRDIGILLQCIIALLATLKTRP